MCIPALIRRCFVLGLLVLMACSALAQTSGADEAAAMLRELYFGLDYEEAVFQGPGLISGHPDSSPLQAWLLINLAAYRQVEDAISQAQVMLERDREDAWAWFAWAGVLLEARQRPQESLEASQQALERMPSNADAIWLRARALAQHDKQKALAFVEAHRNEVENPAELLVVAALVKGQISRRGDPSLKEEAYELFKQAREMDPSNVRAYFYPGSDLAVRPETRAEGFDLLKRAIELSPGAGMPHSFFWMRASNVRGEERNTWREQAAADMRAFFKLRKNRPLALTSIAFEAPSFGLEELGREAERLVERDFPDSRGAELLAANRLSQFADQVEQGTLQKDAAALSDLRRQLRQFIERPRHHEEWALANAFRLLFLTFKGDSRVSDLELLEAAQGMAQHPSNNLRTAYAEGPIALADRGIHLQEAERIVQTGLESLRMRFEARRDSYHSETHYQQALSQASASLHEALGWVLCKQGRLVEAEGELMRAHQADPESLQILHRLGLLSEAAQQPGKAQRFYLDGIAIRPSEDNPCWQALRTLSGRTHADKEAFDDYLTELQEKDRAQRKSEILAQRIPDPQPLPALDLKDLSGQPASAQDLLSKVAVIKFWGRWCIPCVKELPRYQELSDKFRDNPQVTILSINNDPDPATVLTWMQENGYSVPTLHDDRDYARQAGVEGFPTTYFLDPQGRVAYSHTGTSWDLVEEYSWRIEDLTAKPPRR